MRPPDLCFGLSQGAVRLHDARDLSFLPIYPGLEPFLRDERSAAPSPIGEGFAPLPFATQEPVSFGLFANLRAGLKPLWPGVLGIAALTATGCTGKITRETTATLLALEGSVLIQGPSQGEAVRAAELRARIGKGKTLRTGSDASASLMLLPGALIQLGPDSALRIETLSITKDGNALDNAMSRVVLLSLLQGTVDLVVQFQSQPGQWSVETPNGLLTKVLPGTCRLSVKQGTTRMTSLRGAFRFASSIDRSAIEIEGGCFKEWPSENDDAVLAETDGRAQADVDQALDVERKLLELHRREQFTPYPWRHL